jgi:hypothetical protein
VVTGAPTMRYVVRPPALSSTVWICQATSFASAKRCSASGTFQIGPADSVEFDPPALRTGSKAPAADAADPGSSEELLVIFLSTLFNRSVRASWSLMPTSSLSAVPTTCWVCATAAWRLVSVSRVVIWFCNTMPSTNTTAEDSASVETVTRNCSE